MNSSALARSRPLLVGAAFVAIAMSGCGYNEIQGADEQVKAAWAEVANQYQRRADLVPNLVATVKGAADFEKSTLEAVVAARAKATSIQATPELVNDPAAFKKFEEAQGELVERAVAAARHRGALPGPEGERELPRSAGAARGHREPHRGRAQALHRRRRRVQQAACATSRPT